MMTMGTAEPRGQALAINNLSLEFPTFSGAVKALDDVTISVGKAEIVGIVGESGCGKSVTTMAATGLLPKGRYRITGGTVRLFGHSTLSMDDNQLQDLRGKVVSTIFQEPMNALNPTIRIGKQLTDVIMRHEEIGLAEARRVARDILADMLIGEPERVMNLYPFETLRRHAAAGADRHGVFLQSGPDHCRRADDCTRCYRAGGDPAFDPEPGAPDRHVSHLHLAQCRRRLAALRSALRDVCWADRRARRDADGP